MKVAVLLSGGVDSSVALHLAQDAGHEVHAFYLKIWLEDELADLGTCPWEDDLGYARAVCDQAGVALEVLSLQRAYHEQVVADAIHELAEGRTPSPDILCNRRIKFGAFFDALDEANIDANIDPNMNRFDRVVSGHYAQLERRDGVTSLLRGVDPVKDQTYFLYRLDQRQLARCMFPLGAKRKDEVRAVAAHLGLPNRDRPDSQGICFLGKVPFDAFVHSYLGERSGEIREFGTDHVLGHHRGLWFHTVGQRRGLGLHGGPWYVAAKDVASNVVFVVHANGLADHRSDRFTVADPHWIAGTPPAGLDAGLTLATKVRHGPHPAPCHVRSANHGGLDVKLETPDPGIAAGQSAVLYDDNICLGGGVIVTN